MKKTRIEYSSPLDALIAVSKRLSLREEKFAMTSENFYDLFKKGTLDDRIEFVEWANDYQHYLELHSSIETKLNHVA
jgi:uncharacterized protein YhaN